MIEQIDITEFRGIKECESPLELSDFTVLVGRNNSGKSAVLEALHLLRGGQNPLFRMANSKFIKDLHSGKSLAYRNSGKAELEYWVNGEKGLTRVGSGVAEQNVPGTFQYKSILYPSGNKHTDVAYDTLQNVREELEKDGAHVRVVDLLNRCVGDKYTEIYLKTMEARKRAPNADPFYIDINDLGHGLVQTIPIFLSIEAFDPDLFLWDDMGTSLHPSLMNEVLEWLSEQDLQIVAATHSIDVLSSLLDVKPEDASILQLSKTEDDVLHHSRLELDELELVMENAGHDPRYLTEQLEL